ALARRPRPRLLRLVRRQRDVSEGGRPAGGGDTCSCRAAACRDRLPLPLAASRAREAERARTRRAHGRRTCGNTRGGRREARGADRRERLRALLAPMNAFAKKQLGQHFLVDDNILGVIGRLAELTADDVVLEIGP